MDSGGVMEEGKAMEEIKSGESLEKNTPKKSIQPPKISTRALMIMVGISIILVGALGVLAYNNYKDGRDDLTAPSPEPSEAISLVVNSPESGLIVDEGITWVPAEKIDDQKLFEKNNDSAYESTDYYKVGVTSSGGEVLIAIINVNEPIADIPIHRIIKNQDTYKRIVQNSPNISESYRATDKLTDDDSFIFKSLSPDKVISKDQTDLISVQYPSFPRETEGNVTRKKVASTKWGDLLIEQSNSYSANDINQDSQDKTPIVRVARYFIKLNDSTEMSYEVRPKFLRDDNTLDLDFTVSGAENKKYEKFETGGCGFGLGSFPYLIDSASLDGAEKIGEKLGSTVYSIKNTENKTFKYAYMLYKSDGATGKVDESEFADSYGLVYWTDAYGSPIGYLRSEYKPAIECGKPVVYLYPREKTEFKVYVGADVTKSEPKYEKYWSGLAYPSGRLVVGGKDYPNLFWEGKGIGVYPKIDFGRIIESKNAEIELRNDLKEMNLNDQEITDFLDFWLEKMPETKYTRISWLTNEEMDALAPLKVTPKPDSVIRVFLDFAGINTKTELKSQQLPKIQRYGFTVVEWGGLLRG